MQASEARVAVMQGVANHGHSGAATATRYTLKSEASLLLMTAGPLLA